MYMSKISRRGEVGKGFSSKAHGQIKNGFSVGSLQQGFVFT